MFPAFTSRVLRLPGFRPLFALVALLGLSALTSPAVAAGAAAGEVAGRAFNASTATALRNARVTVEGTVNETPTDDVGAYRLYGVPAGPARVTVTYAGLEPQTVSVEVTAGQTAQQDFELSVANVAKEKVVTLQTFTVTAEELSAQAVAMNERQSAPNITNVVAYEEYGDRGDENIGEFLRF